jgi:glycogen synthase
LHAPDLIHLNGYAHGALPWRAPVLMVAHSCVLSWWEAVKGEPAPPRYTRYRDEVTRGIAAADAVVAPSAAMLQAIARHYGQPRRAMVIPNAVSPRRLRHAVTKKPLVLGAGRLWDEAKNAMTVAGIAETLPWPVVLAGETGGIPPAFPNVRFTGHCPPTVMADWFLKASIFAHPARYEPFGLTVLEAAHSGAALVLGDIPSLREIWGDAAWFVDPEDPRALEQALQTLIQQPQLREDLGSQARRRAARHQVTKMRDTYLSIYQSILLMSRNQQLDPA